MEPDLRKAFKAAADTVFENRGGEEFLAPYSAGEYEEIQFDAELSVRASLTESLLALASLAEAEAGSDSRAVALWLRKKAEEFKGLPEDFIPASWDDEESDE